MKATKNGLAIQITTDENEKQKEKLAADQFFSSLLGCWGNVCSPSMKGTTVGSIRSDPAALFRV
jgi:hypothetical protein